MKLKEEKMAMAQQDYIKGLQKKEVEHITLADAMNEMKDNNESVYRQINTMLLTVFHLMQISDKMFAEIEDILQDSNQFRYNIKRVHKKIATEIHDNYMPLFNRIKGMDKNNMYDDNLDLENTVRVWSGLIPDKKVIIEEMPKDGEAIVASLNPIGEICLRNEEGWTIKIPTAFNDAVNIEKSVKDAVYRGEKVECGLRMYIGKKIEYGTDGATEETDKEDS